MFDVRDQPKDLRKRLRRVARASGYSDLAVFLVFYSTSIACRGLPDRWFNPPYPEPIPEDAPVRHLTAVEVCDAICRCARARVGVDAGRYFRHFGLRGGADVGRIMYALIAEGLGSATPDDRPEQFEHIPLLKLLNPIREYE